MTTKIINRPPERTLAAMKERLYERLTDIKAGRKAEVDRFGQWEKGFNDALDAEIKFLTDLLDSVEKS